MDLITILNRCHRFRGFVYQHAYFSADKKSIEVAMRPRKGSAAVCSRCHLAAPGYDQLAERHFEFIPLWGFLVFPLYTMRRVDCRRCGVVAVEEVPWGDGKRTLTKAYMLFLARWARRLSWKETAEAFRTSWDKIFDAVEHVVTFGLEDPICQRPQVFDSGLSDRSRRHAPALGGPRKKHRILSGILHRHRRRTGFADCVRLLRYVGTLPEGHSREMLRGASHPRSFSHRCENEQGTGRNPSGRIASHSERGRRARAEEVSLATAQTRRESEDGTALPVARSAPLQPEDRTCLPS